MRDTDILEQVQQRAMNMTKGMEHLLYKKRLTQLGLFSLEKRRLRGHFINIYKYLMGGVKKMEPGSLQWHPVTKREN